MFSASSPWLDLILIILLGRQLVDAPRGITPKNLDMYNSSVHYIKLKSDSFSPVKSSISIVSIVVIGKLFHSLIVLG